MHRQDPIPAAQGKTELMFEVSTVLISSPTEIYALLSLASKYICGSNANHHVCLERLRKYCLHFNSDNVYCSEIPLGGDISSLKKKKIARGLVTATWEMLQTNEEKLRAGEHGLIFKRTLTFITLVLMELNWKKASISFRRCQNVGGGRQDSVW